MSVYVDLCTHRRKGGRKLYGHLFADSLSELHLFATQLGLKRHWYDGHRWPHYDVNSEQRLQALTLGALPVSKRTMAAHARRHLAAS